MCACSHTHTHTHTCTHMHGHTSYTPPRAAGAEWNPESRQNLRRFCGGEGFSSIGMQISWHLEKVGEQGAEEECGREKNHEDTSLF